MDQSNSIELHNDILLHNKFFKASPNIYKFPGNERYDGWLSPQGIFYGCSEQDHDACATYILRNKYPELWQQLLFPTSEDTPTSWRQMLQEQGYIQVSHSDVLLPYEQLTDKQVKKISDAKLEIPTHFNPEFTIDFSVFGDVNAKLDTIEDVELRTKLKSLYSEFISQHFRLSVNNDHGDVYKLFEILTENHFAYAGNHEDRGGGWSLREEYYYPRDYESYEFAIGFEHYRHAGDIPGLETNDSIRIVSLSEMRRRVGFDPRIRDDEDTYQSQYDDEDSEEYDDDEDYTKDTSNQQLNPQPRIPNKISNLPSRARINDLLDDHNN